VYTDRKQPRYRVHGRVRVVNGPYTRSVNGRVHGTFTRLCTWPCSDHVRPCTGSVPAVNSRVHGPYTAVQTGNGRGRGPKHAHVHDHRVPAVTGPCLGHGRTMYTTLARRCIRSVHGRGHVRRGHGRVNGPCTTGTQAVYMPCLRPVPVFTDTGRKRASV